MLKTSAGLLALGWLALMTIGATGNLSWDNKWLWAPPVAFSTACMLALMGAVSLQEQRGSLLLVAAVGFLSCLAFVVFYVFFVFGAVGRHG